jgi:hypothetical protein
MENPLKYFAELRDPRVERNREHLLEEVVLISIAAVLSGAESWNDIADYGKAKLEWLKTFLTLPSGIPSHDTFNRVFAALDPEQLEKGFVAWVGSIARLTAGSVVAIDGKSLRGTREPGSKAIVHMVSAWAEGNGLVLAQRKVDEKSNEITAIPKLLEALELSGTVVTIDAMGCQRGIAEKIVARQADYILAVKENQASLLDGIRDSFQMLPADAVAEEIDCGHGRVERRTCSVIADLSLLERAAAWPSFTGSGAHPGRALPQGDGQDGDRNPLLHHQPSSPMRHGSTGLSDSTGALKTSCIGCSMSASAKTSAENEQDTPRKTSPSSIASPSTSSSTTSPPTEESRENDSTQHGTTLTSSNYWEFDMRRPC